MTEQNSMDNTEVSTPDGYTPRCCGCRRKTKGIKVPTAVIMVMSGFLINTIYGGLSYTPGLYLNSLLDAYKAGKTVTAWVISLQGSLMYFSGIVAGPLIARYGARPVAVIGALLSSVGYFLSAFSPNVEFLYITFGLLTGVGFGLLMISNSVAVQQHTNQRRALAGGITFVGSGLGAFIMPLVTKWAITLYGWQGSLIFLSGILLNTLPCALLLRPPPVPRPPDTPDVTSSPDAHYDVTSKSAPLLYKGNLTSSRPTINGSTLTLSGHLSHRRKYLTSLHGSTISLPMAYASSLSIHKSQTQISPISIKEPIPAHITSLRRNLTRLKDFITPSFDSEERESFLTPVTILCMLSFFFFFAGMPVLYVFIAVKATKMGFKLNVGANLMSFGGIGEISGRILGALLGTLHENLPVAIFCLMSVVAGSCTASMVLCTTYTHLVATCICFGISTGMATSMCITSLRDLAGMGRLPWMVGMAFTLGGVGNVLSIQTLAFAWEQTGSFFIPYLTGGALLCMSGLSMLGARLVSRGKTPDCGAEVLDVEAEVKVTQY